ncbi:helix-turn-helix transcriptional regulator [Clostridium botulinum C]|uniref:Helix-turn-helix transcriptional regulator n=2 Tax=Clostridium botulinum TaxID=1491 RepID=A0A9Q4TH88_CLOBO|nr:helix-turn-helix transcriptional regulator [Clostridium botulinum C]NFD86809.1 helix-turn-helix transcriptional regulator [Clostridium botulinum]MCD3199163.1 helix-turn-helix transcriptional regulator [Clostridium botulinum C]MCD3204638.1 helix-turn-helix transcriptional regulator [Clostridium botulinum C]MCD3207981.1 helix-turn-helix transcriptional regulator [Clostridium botulinum C]
MLKPNFILKALRIKHQLKQQDVAKLLGISETTYNRKENGVNEFTISEAMELGNIFNINPSEIFFTDYVTEVITKHCI